MKPTVVRLHLTSFGPFLDVVDNPSQRIGDYIANKLQIHNRLDIDDAHSLVLDEHETLEVSLDAVKKYFDDHPMIGSHHGSHHGSNENGEERCKVEPPVEGRDAMQLSSSNEDCTVHLFVHLGVCRGALGQIRVETRAVNTIHCPWGDFKGVVLLNEPIFCKAGNAEEREFDACPTNVDMSTLQVAIAEVNSNGTGSREQDEHDDVRVRYPATLRPSEDAGQYLCNYCFCHSVVYTERWNASHHQGQTSALGIFIHVLDPNRQGERDDTGAVSEPLLNPTVAMQAECIIQFLKSLTARF